MTTRPAAKRLLLGKLSLRSLESDHCGSPLLVVGVLLAGLADLRGCFGLDLSTYKGYKSFGDCSIILYH